MIQFQLTTEDFRLKLYDHILKICNNKNDWLFESVLKRADWNYVVYDSETGFFLSYYYKDVASDFLALTTSDENCYTVEVPRYPKQTSYLHFSEELEPYRKNIAEMVSLYKDEKQEAAFLDSLSEETKARFEKNNAELRDRSRKNFQISCYEDAVKLLSSANYNCFYIHHNYNKVTCASFDAFLLDEKIRELRGEEYQKILTEILTYPDILSEELCTQISEAYMQADNLLCYGLDDIYPALTLQAIQKGYQCKLFSSAYIAFVNQYMKNCVLSYPKRVQELKPLLGFVKEYLTDKNYSNLEYYQKELDQLIYNHIEGFHVVSTTEQQREEMFDYLKPVYRSRNDLDVSNINWVTGVYEKESGIFLTEIYYVPDSIARCGVNYHTYLVIMDEGPIFKAVNNDEFEIRRYDLKIPYEYQSLSEKIEKGISYYEKFSYEYRNNLSDRKKQELRAIEESMYIRCHGDLFD